MATINIEIQITTPTGVTVAEAVDLFARHHSYQDEIDGQPNPETKAQFAKKTIARLVAEGIRAQQIQDAQSAARDIELAKPAITVE